MRLVWLVLLLGMLVGILPALAPRDAAAAEAPQVRYDRFDVDIAIDPSGNFRVTEKQTLTFPPAPSTFTRASRNIGLSSVTDVRDVVVTSGSQTYTQTTNTTSRTPNTFSLDRSDSNLKIEWYFAQAAGQQRSFSIAYTVVGGLRINSDVDVLDWTALRPDLSADAAASTVTVILPQAVDKSQIKTDSLGATAKATIVDGRTVRFDAGAVNRGKGLEVKVSFPHGLVSATAPPWQTQFEQQAQAQARRDSIQNLIILVSFVFGFLILIGGGIGLYLLWYMRGRDRHVGLVADYLREPPSDISPGIAGTLIDERADLQDVLATFADLGRKDVLHIDEVQTPGMFGVGGQHDFVVDRLDSNAPLSTFEQTLLNTIFIGGGTQVKLSEVKASLVASLPRFGDQLYAEVVNLGYFTVSPEKTRRRYRSFGIALIGLAAFAWLALLCTVGTTAGGLTFAAFPLGIVGLALVGLSRAMPAKTEKGAEEAAKWNAFKRYLENLEKYDKLEEAKGIFERYLPYATAFGLDKSFIQKFATVNTPAPHWYGGGGGPVIIGSPGGGYYGGGGGGYYGTPGSFGNPGNQGDAGSGGGGGFNIPSLQDLSDRGGGGLQGWSDSLSDMLSSASGAFGGGGGGGGSDSGWSGGGGGGGWGGGGDSGGGGGGGGDSGGGGGGDFG